MADVIEHDWQRWGAAFTHDGRPLTRVADVVKSCLSARAPLKIVADQILESIASCTNTELFLLRPNNLAGSLLNAQGEWDGVLLASSWFGYDATDVHRSEFYEWWDWTDGDASPFKPAEGDPRTLWGALGLLACMHYLWTQRAVNVEDLDKLPTGAVAVLTVDAERLLAAFKTAPLHGLHTSQIAYVPKVPDARGVQPAGGRWKHVKGARWTEDHKVAMKKMRAGGMADDEIATAVGCTRQRVAQLIGSANAVGGLHSVAKTLTLRSA